MEIFIIHSMTSVLYFYSCSIIPPICKLFLFSLLFVKERRGEIMLAPNTCATSILGVDFYFIVCFFFRSFFVISIATVIYEWNLKPLQLLCLLSIEQQLNWPLTFLFFHLPHPQLNFGISNLFVKIYHKTTIWWTRLTIMASWCGSLGRCWWTNIQCQIYQSCK